MSAAHKITTYTFNTGTAKHIFCSVCGIKSFYVPRSKPDGYSVNVHCLDDGQVRVTRIGLFDGQHWEEALPRRRGSSDMSTEILMPRLSPTMEEGKLAKWHVKEGDAVRSGDVVAEVETDKATMEVEAAEDGVIGKLLLAEGTEHVPVNHPIAVMEMRRGGDLVRRHARLRRPSGGGRCAQEARLLFTHPRRRTTASPSPLPDGARGTRARLSRTGAERDRGADQAERPER